MGSPPHRPSGFPLPACPLALGVVSALGTTPLPHSTQYNGYCRNPRPRPSSGEGGKECLPTQAKMQAQLRPCRGVAAFSSAGVKAPVGRRSLHVCNSAVAKPVTLPVKGADGSDKGSKSLALRVAEASATGLVHRYLVLVQQNERKVRRGLYCLG